MVAKLLRRKLRGASLSVIRPSIEPDSAENPVLQGGNKDRGIAKLASQPGDKRQFFFNTYVLLAYSAIRFLKRLRSSALRKLIISCSSDSE